MKKIIISVFICLCLVTLIGCNKSKTSKIITEDTSKQYQIVDPTRFKLLNIRYVVPGTTDKYVYILCDTDTKLLYLDTTNQSPFNKIEINKNGEVVTKQYTLDEFKNDYKNKHGKDITFINEE